MQIRLIGSFRAAHPTIIFNYCETGCNYCAVETIGACAKTKEKSIHTVPLAIVQFLAADFEEDVLIRMSKDIRV